MFPDLGGLKFLIMVRPFESIITLHHHSKMTLNHLVIQRANLDFHLYSKNPHIRSLLFQNKLTSFLWQHQILISRLKSCLKIQLETEKILMKLQTSLVMMSQTSYWEWITFHFILRRNHKQFVPEIQFSTVQYFCEVVPNAAVFIVVFQVHVNLFNIKLTEFDEKLFFEVIRNGINFRLGSFLLYIRVPYGKKFRLQFLTCRFFCIQWIFMPTNIVIIQTSMVYHIWYSEFIWRVLVQTQVAQNRGLTLDIIIPDVCQVPVSMLSFSRVGLVFTFCSTCKLINVVKLSLRKYIWLMWHWQRVEIKGLWALPLTPLFIVELQLVLHGLHNIMIRSIIKKYKLESKGYYHQEKSKAMPMALNEI